MSAEEDSSEQAEAVEENQLSKCEYLLVEVGGRQAAVPLADVLRIEQLALSRIEYIGYRPVLNFEGQLLPVEDTGGVLSAAAERMSAVQGGTEGEGSKEAEVVVVVCRDGNRHVGIAVSQVLDVAAGGDLFEAGSSQRTDGVTLLKSRVTGVVDLGGVQSLPATAEANPGWSHAEVRVEEMMA